MIKINLLVSHDDMNSFCAEWMQQVLTNFNIIYFEHGKKYDKKNTIIVTNCMKNTNWYKNLYDEGFKIIIDNLWEPLQKTKLLGHVCVNKNWFWYNESLWYRHKNLQEYVPNKKYTKDAFVPMNLKKSFRDKLFEIILRDETKYIYSYKELGYCLPNDTNDPEWQRFFNPNWYDDTWYSIVAETLVDNNLPLFITEKTFKPIAFYHPFIIVGQPKLLSRLRELGFTTFDNLFDESYDNLNNIDEKLDIIQKNITSFNKEPYDKFTHDKIAHNHNLFFNKQLVLSRIKQEIIEPILNYAET